MSKILMYIGIPIIILIIIFVLTALYFSSILNRNYKPNEITIGNGEKSALLIYSPSNGSGTENMSKNIADNLSQKNYTVKINHPSENLNYNLNDFDIVIFGTPVYAGKVSSSLEKYIKSQHIKNQNITLFVTGMLTDKHEEEKLMETWFNSSNRINSIKITKKDFDKMNSFIMDNIK